MTLGVWMATRESTGDGFYGSSGGNDGNIAWETALDGAWTHQL